MSYYDDDYYEEPSEFDEMVEEFKAKLAESVKEETQTELANLRAENAELRGKVENLAKLENDAAAAQRRADQKAANAEYEAKIGFSKKKFGELIKELTDPKFTVQASYVTGEKCGECDKDRNITFLSPQGRKHSVQCQCADRTRVFGVQEEFVVEIQKSRMRGQSEFTAWYQARPLDRDEDYMRHSRWLKKPSELTEEETLSKHYEVGFDNREDAQKIADLLNNKEATK